LPCEICNGTRVGVFVTTNPVRDTVGHADRLRTGLDPCQNLDAQHDALVGAGCDEIMVDKASGKLARRPELDKALLVLRKGDQLVVTKLDRLGRSLEHLISLSKDLPARGVDLVVLPPRRSPGNSRAGVVERSPGRLDRRQAAQTVGVELVGQVQRGVRGTQVGGPRVTVGETLHGHGAHHRRQLAVMAGLHVRVDDTVDIGNLDAPLAQGTQVQVILNARRCTSRPRRTIWSSSSACDIDADSVPSSHDSISSKHLRAGAKASLSAVAVSIGSLLGGVGTAPGRPRVVLQRARCRLPVGGWSELL